MAKNLSDSQKATILADDSGLKHVHPEPKNASAWIGGYSLGSGGFGQVCLWICLDNKTHKPIKQVAIKDTFEIEYVSTEERYPYTNVYYDLVTKGMDFGVDPFSGAAPGYADPARRFLKEAYIQGIMTEPNSTEEIYSVPLWGYSRKPTSLLPGRNQWRLYMPLYEYGDLFDLIHAHYLKKRGIPEPFIWHTLRCLLIAVEQLAVQARKRIGSTNSDFIAVMDMKPENIFLAPPDQTSTFPIYPRPYLADLGGACLVNQHSLDHRIGDTTFSVTPGFRPPEALRHSVFDYKDYYTIGEWTNIWQIGRVAEAMMKLAPGFKDLSYDVGDREPQIQNWIGQLPGQFYSWQLRSAVAQCTRFKPDQRATARDLLHMIDNNPVWLLHRHRMHTFGSDAWFEEQEQKQAEQAASATPAAAASSPTPSETAAAETTSTKKRKRMEDATSYLRAWDANKRAKFVELGVLPDEKFDLEYSEKNKFWAKADVPLADSNLHPVRSLPYVRREKSKGLSKGQKSTFGISKLKIASSNPAVAGDSDVGMSDAFYGGHGGDGGGGGDDDQGGDGAHFKISPSEPFCFLPPEESGAVDGQGGAEDQNDDDRGYYDSDGEFHYYSEFPFAITQPEELVDVNGKEEGEEQKDEDGEGEGDKEEHGAEERDDRVEEGGKGDDRVEEGKRGEDGREVDEEEEEEEEDRDSVYYTALVGSHDQENDEADADLADSELDDYDSEDEDPEERFWSARG